MKQRTRWLGWVLLGCIVAGVSCYAFLPSSAISRENAAKVREGMTLTEVEELLGGPARDESSGPLEAEVPESEEPESADSLAMERAGLMMGFTMAIWIGERPPEPSYWTTNRLMVRVDFDPEGRVKSSRTLEVRRVQESPWDRVRRWLRL